MRTLAPIKPGARYGRLAVIRPVKNEPGRHVLCRCTCGATTVVRFANLLRGNTKSCGCLKRDMASERLTTHGQSGTKLHYVWIDMRQRCENENSDRFELYGERGISVCDEWQDFESFRAWALANGYQEGLTIDRIDVNGNYTPANCRWVTQVVQCNNTRRNKMLTHNGKTMSMADWSRYYNLNYHTLRSRLRIGWSVKKALETPMRGSE